jgi:TRAP-type C4-dicarboxylate transport system permease small subunit
MAVMGEEELQKIVEETRELSKDNNRILHSIQRRERLSLIAKVIYWSIILGVAAGAFYYIQPYIEQIQKAYSGMIDTQHKVADFSGKFSLDNLKSYFK